MKFIKPIGGEFWFTPEIFNKNSKNFKNIKATFLSGGQSALRAVLNDLEIGKGDIILMPNHLCPTILYSLHEKNIKYIFYKINKDLSIDLKSLEEKISNKNIKAIYIINYFGFYHNRKTIEFLKKMREKYNFKIIEDAVQMLWFKNNNFIGDYVFNSYRKFVPIDGSILLSKNNRIYKETKDKYYELINKGRSEKKLYIDYEIGNEENYLNTFKEAEKFYYKRKEAYGMNIISKKLLSSLDIEYIKKKRQENYKYLYEKIKKIEFIETIFDINKINDNIPLGFPVYIKNNNRDKIRKLLMNNKIYCPIHWNINNEIGKNILTIPIDQRYDFKDMDRVIFSFLKSSN
ncbi:DegT/DnrJ/EryC1/StrS family aminotransferase [Tepidibacter formicigenes]|jgi:dTDP-4-amino-4,6-dideoxygalactose transaminase|uniref:dTDP-4-amino-4,6-dideoxygalactose transaminase n=1 Tax=Tepidibacter formicigenes DSM 15518 TaxID=1123349 RepID=A0A1M6P041_9FIRM|nr:DegT/DnrJ/EryC1/StrS family aminotransferase [Tepidibacter formicigenes]SHK01278.1 dTDP-4-amino-4,6-dideoxygalactose transaminase [Tepidibacter formicigenes DSM 15518]